MFGITKIKKPKQIEIKTKPEAEDEQKYEETEAREISLKTLERMEEEINKITLGKSNN